MKADQPRELPWGFILIVGALGSLGILLLVVPGLFAPDANGPVPETTRAGGPSPGPSQRPNPTPDPHVVVTNGGTVHFAFEEGAIVIRRIANGTTVELGRVAVPASDWPIEFGGSLRGAAAYAMVCPSATGPETDWFMFGYARGSGVNYRGPAAIGGGTSDGLFLFAIAPGDHDPAALFEVENASGSIGITGRSFEIALTRGEEQPSGCRVA